MKKKKIIIIISIVVVVIILFSIGGVFAFITIKNKLNNNVTIKEEIKQEEKETKKEEEKESPKTNNEEKTESSKNYPEVSYYRTKNYARENLIIEANDNIESNKETAIQLLKKYGFNYFYGCKYSMLEKSYDNTLKSMITMNHFNMNSASLDTYNGVKLEEKKKCTDIFNIDDFKDINEHYLVYVGKVANCPMDYEGYIVHYNDANKIYKDLFNTNMPKESIDGSKLGMNEEYSFEYVSSQDLFILLQPESFLGYCASRYGYIYIDSVKEENNRFEIELYLANATNVKGDSKGTIYTFKKFDYTSTNTNYGGSDETVNEYIKEHLDKVDMYKVEFKKINNEYKLDKYTRIKEA